MDQKEKFAAEVQAACHESREIGYAPSRFEQMLSDYGAFDTAKRLVISGDLQDGLQKLAALGRLDLSIESIMLRSEFSDLFCKTELEAARWRLDQVKGN